MFIREGFGGKFFSELEKNRFVNPRLGQTDKSVRIRKKTYLSREERHLAGITFIISEEDLPIKEGGLKINKYNNWGVRLLYPRNGYDRKRRSPCLRKRSGRNNVQWQIRILAFQGRSHKGISVRIA